MGRATVTYRVIPREDAGPGGCGVVATMQPSNPHDPVVTFRGSSIRCAGWIMDRMRTLTGGVDPHYRMIRATLDYRVPKEGVYRVRASVTFECDCPTQEHGEAESAT